MRRANPQRARARREPPRGGARGRGLSLIEVLIAVLVLGFGLLGLALLQATNLRLTQSSNARTVATSLGSRLLDDIRNNRLIAAGYAGRHRAKDVPANCAVDPSAVKPNAQIRSFACALRKELGESAQAEVVVNAATGAVSVRIEWGDAQRWSPKSPATQLELESRL